MAACWSAWHCSACWRCSPPGRPGTRNPSPRMATSTPCRQRIGNPRFPLENTMSALILVVFLGAAVAAMPIAHALLLAAMAAAATSDRVPLDLLVQQMVAQVQSFPLIAIPFFMLTGSLMMGGKLGEALVGVLSALIGRFHGGPAQVGVLSSTLFGGVSGSAVADASAIGSLLIPWHKRLGYPAAFSAATLAAAATIDIMIPPSIPMILFALSSNASIAELFIAGVLPGFLMCGGF